MNPELAPIYAQFLSLGGPLQFQAFSPTVPWAAAVQNGLAYKPTQIEIWDTTAVKGGMAPLTAADLTKFASAVMGD